MLVEIDEVIGLYATVNDTDYGILYLTMTESIDAVTECTIAISAGIGDVEVDLIPMDAPCSVYIETREDTNLLFSGFIASENHELSSNAVGVKGYKTYRVALNVEMIDAIAPVSVRLLTGAHGIEHALQDSYLTVNDSSAYAETTSLIETLNNQAQNDVGNSLLRCIDNLYHAIKVRATDKEAAEHIRKYVVSDVIKINAETNPPIHTKIAKMLSEEIKGGNAYMQALGNIQQEMYLSTVPYYDKEKGHVLKITHINNWAKPTAEDVVDLHMYHSMYGFDSSTKSQQVDGICIPLWMDANEAPNTASWTFYGRLKDEKKAKIINITPQNVEQVSVRNRLKMKQMMFPSWLTDGLAFTLKVGAEQAALADPQKKASDCSARLCKEFFANYAFASRTLSINVPFHYHEYFEKRIGKVVEVKLLKKHITDSTQVSDEDKESVLGVVSSVSLTMELRNSKLAADVIVSLTHIRTPEEQESYEFNDSELLYKVTKEI